MHPEELTDLAGPSTPRVLHWTDSWRIGRPIVLPRGLATEQRSHRALDPVCGWPPRRTRLLRASIPIIGDTAIGTPRRGQGEAETSRQPRCCDGLGLSSRLLRLCSTRPVRAVGGGLGVRIRSRKSLRGEHSTAPWTCAHSASGRRSDPFSSA